MRESEIEKAFKRIVEKAGARVIKFTPQGINGMPDRIVLIPGGKVIFVEFKAPGEKLRVLQKKRFEELRELGFRAIVIDSLEKIGPFLVEEMGL